MGGSRNDGGDYGLPTSWLNGNAGMFVPPPPDGAMDEPTDAGLHVRHAPKDHLLAMKMVASRAKDRPDLERLIIDNHMLEATPDDYADLLERVYAGEDVLAHHLGISQGPEAVRAEAILMGESMVRLANRLKTTPTPKPLP